MLAQLALMLFCLEGGHAAPLDDYSASSDNSLSVDQAGTAPAQAGLLELLRQLEMLRNQLTSLNGRLEVQSHEVELLREQQKKMYTDLDSRLAALEKLAATLSSTNAQGNLSQSPAGENVNSKQTTTPQLPVLPQDQGSTAPQNPPLPSQQQIANTPEQPGNVLNEFQMYSAAKDLFDRGQYEEAIAAFQKFIATFPQSSNAAAAQYWIGNAYYALKRYDEAIKAQQTLIDQYPKHPKVPDAWLNIASSLIAQGKIEEAKSTLRRIIAEYPLSEASEAALSRLRTLP
jgi:tol-pal system protein YbgF